MNKKQDNQNQGSQGNQGNQGACSKGKPNETKFKVLARNQWNNNEFEKKSAVNWKMSPKCNQTCFNANWRLVTIQCPVLKMKKAAEKCAKLIGKS